MQKQKSIGARVFSLVLTAAMVCAMLPATAFAASTEADSGTSDSGVMALASGNVAEVTSASGTSKGAHSTLVAAFAAATEDGDTVKVLADIALPANGYAGISHNNGKAVTLDLNGCTVEYAASGTAIDVDSSSSLTIIDSTSVGGASNGTLEATNADTSAITNSTNGTVTVSSGTVMASGEGGYGIYNASAGTVAVDGGGVQTNGDNGMAIFNYYTGTVTVNGGGVLVGGENSMAIYNYEAGPVTVSSGTVGAVGKNSKAIVNESNGTVTVSGGSVQTSGATSTSIYNVDAGKITVNGGTVKAVGKDSYAIYNHTTGTVAVSSGTVHVGGENSTAIYNNHTSPITISGGTVEATGEESPAIFSAEGQITISGDQTLVKSVTALTSRKGTILITGMPSPARNLLTIQGGEVGNGAAPEGYSVYFSDSNITVDNLSNYYTEAATATVGKLHPGAVQQFVPVTNITGIPATVKVGASTTLNGTVTPSNATNKTITWQVTNAGTTGATITNGVLSTPAAGTVTITATIANGASATTAYTKTFSVTVSNTPTPTPTPTPGGGGGSTPSSWKPATANEIDNPIGATGSTNTLTEAVKAALAAGKTSSLTYVRYANYEALLKDGLAAINNAAAAATKGKSFQLNTRLQLDSTSGTLVLSRITVDPAALAAVMPSTLPLGVHYNQNDVSVLTVSERFAKYFGNKMVVVTYDQPKPLAVNAEFAAKLELSGLNAKTLYFYSYDHTTNRYNRVPAPNFFMDKYGYAHFTAPLGGSVIITDKPLANK